MNLLDRITINPEILHGKPIIRGMRWSVEMVLDLLGSGMQINEIIEDHPELEKEDILACLHYAKLSLSGKPILQVAS
jgi:uncharacterized protein (DUF433 family)